MILRKSFLFWLVLIFLSPYAFPRERLGREFDQRAEFPRYFLREKYRSMPPDGIPSQEISRSKGLLQEALWSVLSRLTIPLMQDGQLVMVPYFEYLTSKLSELDAQAKIMPSGGVVRAAIAYLYEELYQADHQKKPLKAETVLRRIAKAKDPLPGLKVRGVGSDLDVLLIARNAQALTELQRRGEAITSSAEHQYGFRSSDNEFKRAAFAIPDFKDYREQTLRSTRQGGSSIDFLAFDLQARRFVEPYGFDGIVDDMIRGVYSYLAPAHEDAMKDEDVEKQIVRGGRPLLELPFLRLKNDRVLRSELADLERRIERGFRPSYKTYEQFAKMIRNARYSGAHNRFYRTPPVVDAQESIESIFLRISRKILKDKSMPPLPEFVDIYPLDERVALADDPLAGLLISVGEFKRRHMPTGKCYHGTPNPQNALAILRGGLFISSDNQGVAAFGRGAYCSPDAAVARGYAGPQGVVFELEIRDDARLRILDWESLDHDQQERLTQMAHRQGRDVFEMLARDFQVDLIVNHHILLENMAAVETPGLHQAIFQAFWQTLNQKTASFQDRFGALKSYSSLYAYALALGEVDLPAPPAIEQFIQEAMASIVHPLETQEMTNGMRELEKFGYSPEESRQSILKRAQADLIQDFVGVLADPVFQDKVPLFLDPIMQTLRYIDYIWRELRVAESLKESFPEDPAVKVALDEITRRHLHTISDPSTLHRDVYELASSFSQISPDMPEVRRIFEGWLESSDHKLKKVALRFLAAMGVAMESHFDRAIRDIYIGAESFVDTHIVDDFFKTSRAVDEGRAFAMLLSKLRDRSLPPSLRHKLVGTLAKQWPGDARVRPLIEGIISDATEDPVLRLEGVRSLQAEKFATSHEHFQAALNVFQAHPELLEKWPLFGYLFMDYARLHSDDPDVMESMRAVSIEDSYDYGIAHVTYGGISFKVSYEWAVKTLGDRARQDYHRDLQAHAFVGVLRSLAGRELQDYESKDIHIPEFRSWFGIPAEALVREGARFLGGRSNTFVPDLFRSIKGSTEEYPEFEREFLGAAGAGARVHLLHWLDSYFEYRGAGSALDLEWAQTLIFLKESSDRRLNRNAENTLGDRFGYRFGDMNHARFCEFYLE